MTSEFLGQPQPDACVLNSDTADKNEPEALAEIVQRSKKDRLAVQAHGNKKLTSVSGINLQCSE